MQGVLIVEWFLRYFYGYELYKRKYLHNMSTVHAFGFYADAPKVSNDRTSLPFSLSFSIPLGDRINGYPLEK